MFNLAAGCLVTWRALEARKTSVDASALPRECMACRARSCRPRNLQRERVETTLRELSDSELEYAAEVLEAIKRARFGPPGNPDTDERSRSIARANIAKLFATRWGALLIEALSSVENWNRQTLLTTIHLLLRRSEEQLELDPDESVALGVMSVAASYLHTGIAARGAIVRRGDQQTFGRLRQAHDALFGKSDNAKGIREVVGILEEGMALDFVTRRLRALHPAFEGIEAGRLKELLASYTEKRPTRGSGKRTLRKIAAAIVVEAGAYGIRRRQPNERPSDLEARTEDVRRRIDSIMRNG
jgi:hypothetical protein